MNIDGWIWNLIPENNKKLYFIFIQKNLFKWELLFF